MVSKFMSLGKQVHKIKTLLYPTFIKQNKRMQGIPILFLYVIQNIVCGYSLEPPHHNQSFEQDIFQ